MIEIIAALLLALLAATSSAEFTVSVRVVRPCHIESTTNGVTVEFGNGETPQYQISETYEGNTLVRTINF